MCHDVNIFFNFDFVYGSLFFLPSNFIRVWARLTSYFDVRICIERKKVWNSKLASSLRYHGLEISGTSGRIKNPLIATGREITPSIINSLDAS